MLRLALSLLILMTTSEAVAQEPQQVAVLNLIRFNGTRGAARNILEKERFDSAFARSLEASGWSVMQVADDACGDGIECLAALAKRLGVSRVVRINGQGNVQDGYQLTVEAFRPKAARTEKGIDCETCNPARIAGLAAESAQQQLAAVAREEDPAKVGPSSPLLSPATTAEPDRTSITPPPNEEHAGYRWVSWTLLAVALPATAYGAWALYKNGDTSNPATEPVAGDRHHERYSSKTLGIACLASGIGAALLAGVIYIFEPTKTTSVAFSPTSVDFSVRF